MRSSKSHRQQIGNLISASTTARFMSSGEELKVGKIPSVVDEVGREGGGGGGVGGGGGGGGGGSIAV